MKFSVGYQADDQLKAAVFRNFSRIGELYFPWDGFTTGRGTPEGGVERRRREADLAEYAAAGLKMNWLLNGNCYGRHSQSRKFFQSIGDTAEQLTEELHLAIVTTTSPLIARFIKQNFTALEVRASVNLETGTPESLEYLLPWFDSFYLKREFNYDLARLHRMRDFCRNNGKKLFLLANSGCLNFCSARNFHDNLVAHQHEIAEMDNAFEFHGVCRTFLETPEHRRALLRHSNFIRPEDVASYEGLCDGMKLATRVSRNPGVVIQAYCSRHYSGNLLDLTEPDHAGHFYPEIIANDRIPKNYAEHRLHCDRNCSGCSFCDDIQKNAVINLNATGEKPVC